MNGTQSLRRDDGARLQKRRHHQLGQHDLRGLLQSGQPAVRPTHKRRRQGSRRPRHWNASQLPLGERHFRPGLDVQGVQSRLLALRRGRGARAPAHSDQRARAVWGRTFPAGRRLRCIACPAVAVACARRRRRELRLVKSCVRRLLPRLQRRDPAAGLPLCLLGAKPEGIGRQKNRARKSCGASFVLAALSAGHSEGANLLSPLRADFEPSLQVRFLAQLTRSGSRFATSAIRR